MSGDKGIWNKLFYLIIVLLLSISVVNVVKGEVVATLTPILLTIIYVVGRTKYFLKAVLVHGALTALSSSGLYVAIPSAICSALVIMRMFDSHEERRAAKSIIVAASFIPLYIYSIPSLLNGLGVALVILGKYVVSYAAISTAKSYMHERTYETLPDTTIEIALEVEAKSRLNWRIYIDDREVARLESMNRGVVRINLVERYLGEHHRRLSVVASDPWGFCKRKVTQVDIVIKVIPRIEKLLRQVEKLLAKYVSIITLPRVYRAALILPTTLFSPMASPGKVPGADVQSLATIVADLQTGVGVATEGEAITKSMLIDKRIAVEAKHHTESESSSRITMVWLPYTRLYGIIGELISALSHYGEYIGARDYHPGDPPRRIHWKKSVSLNKLIVKEYSRLGEDQSKRGIAHVLVADWISTNQIDLDQAVSITLEFLLALPPIENCLLMLTTQNGNTYLISGKTVDVLTTVYLLVKNEVSPPYYDYRIEKYISTAYVIKDAGGLVLEQLYEYYKAIADLVLKTFSNNNVTPGTSVTIIYNPPTSAKYSVISSHLSSSGYFINVIRVSRKSR